MNYEPQGGGGTDFMCNWEYMKQEDIQPNRFVMFTDGYPVGSWGDEFYCETVFVIHGPDHIKPPFGNYAYYEEKKTNLSASSFLLSSITFPLTSLHSFTNSIRLVK